MPRLVGGMVAGRVVVSMMRVMAVAMVRSGVVMAVAVVADMRVVMAVPVVMAVRRGLKMDVRRSPVHQPLDPPAE